MSGKRIETAFTDLMTYSNARQMTWIAVKMWMRPRRTCLNQKSLKIKGVGLQVRFRLAINRTIRTNMKAVFFNLFSALLPQERIVWLVFRRHEEEPQTLNHLKAVERGNTHEEEDSV